MTTANKITITRILLIPVFVLFALYYGDSASRGSPDERWRWAAVLVFVAAAASDGLDGWVARRFNQRSRLGVILDPIADKGLLLTAIVTLSLADWPAGFPLWFPILVVARDAITISGTLLVHHLTGDVRIKPHWTGKVATFLQMVAIGWVMLEIPVPDAIVPTALAGVFVLISGVIYVSDGIRQVNAAGHGGPDHPHN